MSSLTLVAIALVVAVAAVAFATRRKTVDPLARARSGDRAKEAGALTLRALVKVARASGAVLDEVAADLRAGRKIDAIRKLREACDLDLVDAKRAAEELESQLASGGPLARLLEGGAPPKNGDPA